MDHYDFMEQIVRLTDEYIENNFKQVKPAELRLDYRCGLLYVSKDAIATNSGSNRSLRYYGGFEYIDNDYIFNCGEWVIYSAEDPRVQDHIEWYNEHKEQKDAV